jgi:hypothetical protein
VPLTLRSVLTMVAVLPETPLLVPALATGASAGTEQLRATVADAAARLAGAARRWIAVGSDPGGRRTVGPRARGSFRGFGVDVEVALGPTARGPADPCLPLPLLIAGWAAAGAAVSIRGELLSPHTPGPDCAALGVAIGAECRSDPEPVGVLALGDGSAVGVGCDPRFLGLERDAAGFDATVNTALRAADVAALAGLDAALAESLHATGRAPWQVLAAATGPGWRGELLHSAAPHGVTYHVAVWTPGVVSELASESWAQRLGRMPATSASEELA